MFTDPTRVLVADDDSDIRDLVTFKLEQGGYVVEPVSDGVQAWESICASPPRLAVLDVMMPGLSGLDVLRKLRDDERTKDVPVILLTARSRESDVDTGYASGANEYIIKPFSPRELLHRVAAVVGRG
ncbi:MAG: response regulator [Austwickia sp.]|jgi:two-component system, OmpR family, response regulator|nr:response regulator [Austwickia sp.]MBK8436851.1 response regulator [Austwickia sp.]MBK9100479.1 response regulator [Austwickia sp.]